MWDGLVFEKGIVTVQAKLMHVERRDPEGDGTSVQSVAVSVWSVTRS